MGSVFALRVGHKRFLPLLDLGRPVPSTRLFTTLADAQSKAIFQFYYRDRPGSQWRPVGRIEWEALPPAPAGEPTLELRLIPERAGSLQLRLRERSTGVARSYRLRLPEAPPEAPQEAPPEVPRRESLPAEKKTVRWRTVIGLALAAILLAAAAVLLVRLSPFKKTAAEGKPAAETASTAEAHQAPAQTPTPAVEPEESSGGESGPEAVDAASGATTQEPADQAGEPASPASDPKTAVKPEPPAQKPPAKQRSEALSYRVQWGDTLWQITKQYYGNPYLFSLLAGENAIVDPNLIISGTELRLPPRIDERDRKDEKQ